jgi:hypothetical protein
MKSRLTAYIGVRLTKENRTAFIRRARKEYNVGASEALRELVVAFAEGRVTVAPSQPKEFLK